MAKCWIAVASREHVLRAVRGGFAQVNHGKEAPLRRLSPGDTLIYYSPREGMGAGIPVQAFTALGEVEDQGVYQAVQSERFRPFRRRVRYLDVHEAPIRPLLPMLSFSRDGANWGQVLRRGLFRVEPGDGELITAAMRGDDRAFG